MSHPLSMVDRVGLPRFAVVDLETSGLSPRRHRILQVGVVTVEADGTVVDEWESMVHLRWPVSRVGPTHVHGITRSMLKDAPRLDTVLDELAKRVNGSVFTAHNARFDAAFLERAARRRDRSDSLNTALRTRLCTLRMSRRLDPERKQAHDLAELCRRYDVSLDRPHNALADAHATAEILPHLLAEHQIHDAADLTQFYDRP